MTPADLSRFKNRSTWAIWEGLLIGRALPPFGTRIILGMATTIEATYSSKMSKM